LPLPLGQAAQYSQLWPSDQRLACEESIQRIIALCVLKAKEARALYRSGNVLGVTAAEKDRDEFRAHRSRIIQLLFYQARLPEYAMPLAWFLLAVDSSEIGFSVHHQYEIGFPDLVVAPSGPSFRRQHFVLIDTRVYAIGTQPIGQFQHPILVLGAVMAVADEDPWCDRLRHWKLP